MYQFDKQHATTVIANADLAECRFVTAAGTYASGAAGAGGGNVDSAGISENDALIDEVVSVVTDYSYTVEAGAAIAQYAFVKPGIDGKAITGAIDDHCGIALEAAAGDGSMIECRIVRHVHPVA